eukprot:TRINITY_DN7938_c0_g1_i2.p1 TRINITY_DN7938_c0_g1~~TRINITY_DN7938_c0_g1_i2.p1  ORF type:complete len:802 (+),score=196.15 TRINITY_DN7938_c0_g1_i2:46-2451(+)
MPARIIKKKQKEEKAPDWRDGVDCSVKVFLRVRPFNRKEISEMSSTKVKGDPGAGQSLCVTNKELESKSVVVLRGPTSCTLLKEKKGVPKQDRATEGLFHFDKVFNCVSEGEGSQMELFQTVGPELLDAALCGYNICLMAYGQTSSGKTFTMTGGDQFHHPTHRGIIPRFLDGLFSRMGAKEATHPNIHFKLEAGYMEIYSEQVRDLLRPNNRKRLQVREHPQLGPFADGLTMSPILSPSAISKLLETGDKSRHVRATKMNDQSSRSHAILQLVLTQFIAEEGPEDEEPHMATVVSKINLVDLAGSERQKASGVEGEGRREAIHINTALHCLRKVIDSLTEDKRSQGALRALQRESILTWLLADSLGGNSKTVLIATVSPASVNTAETLSTLKYASAARAIENVIKVNTDGQTAVIQALEDEIQRLADQLQNQDREKREQELRLRQEEQRRLEEALAENQAQLANCSEEHLRERTRLQNKLIELEEQNQTLEQMIYEMDQVEKDLQQQLQAAKAQLKSLLGEQNRSVHHQNQLSVEMAELRHESDGKTQQINQLERKFYRDIELLVKGNPKFDKLIKAATKPVKGYGGGPKDPAVVELYFTRLQNEALQLSLESTLETLNSAFKENARLSSIVSGAMTQIADAENRQLNFDDQDATIRRLQQQLDLANTKEEKYLGQLKDLSFEHLLLKKKYLDLRDSTIPPPEHSNSSDELICPPPPPDGGSAVELPPELQQACDFFGFRDPIAFSKWVVKTLGVNDGEQVQGDGPVPGSLQVKKSNHALLSNDAISLRSTFYGNKNERE